MSTYIIFNGSLMKESALPAEELMRAIHYGDSLFETMKHVYGCVMLLSEHLERLNKGMKVLGMKCAGILNTDLLNYHINKLMHANGLEHGRLRLTLIRSGKGYYSPLRDEAHYLIQASPLPCQQYTAASVSRVDFFSELRKQPSPLTEIKSAQNMIHILAGRYARTNGLDDCLILNNEENVAESISSNVFLVKGRNLFTPSSDQGCMEGIMRSFIINHAILMNLEVTECAVFRDQVFEADEVFLTNVIQGVVPVQQISGHKFQLKLSKGINEYVNKTLIRAQ